MTIGEKLKQKRMELGLSLEDISNEIKISSKILEKIESNENNHGMAPAILKGFIRSYSKHLKIERQDVTVPDVNSNNRSSKTDRELIESNQDASPFSWIKWGVAGSTLILIALGVKVVQKYQAETYQAKPAMSQEKERALNPIPEPLREPSNPEVAHEVEPPAQLPKNEALVTPLPDAVAPLAEASTTPSPGSENIDRSQESSVTPRVTPESAITSATTILTKEVILEARKSTSIRIKPQDKIATERQLEGGKFYLFREVVPFSIKGEDAGAIQVMVNGRIIHSPRNSGQPINLEIKE